MAFSIFSIPATAQTRPGQPWTDQSFMVANDPLRSLLAIAVTGEIIDSVGKLVTDALVKEQLI